MLSLLLFAALSSSSPDVTTTVIPRSARQLAAVADAERIGRDIYDFDQAAWGSTDALVAAMPSLGSAGVRGWIVEREPGGTVATYYGLSGDQPYKMFVAHMHGRTVHSSHVLAATEDRRMSPVERRMVAARQIALAPETLQKLGFRQCVSAAFNSVVLVPATLNAPTPVYVLTPQSSGDTFPIGGHYRIDVAPDGSIGRSRRFANTCIVMDRRKSSFKPELFFVTHLLDPQPTEIHVWVSLAGGSPLAVGMAPSGDVWTVADGIVKYVYTLPGKSSPAQ